MGKDSKSIVVAREPARWNERVDLRAGEWGFHLNFKTGLFEIYRPNRPELAHLTIKWGTKSGDVDVHLTYRHEGAMSDGHSKNWESLFKLTNAHLEAVGFHMNEITERIMMRHLRKSYRKFRPGWLAHRGYFVTVYDDDTMMKWLRDLAPKTRGKYRFDPKRLDANNYPPELVDNAYDPRILHELKEQGREFVEYQGVKWPRIVPASRVRRQKIVAEDGLQLTYGKGRDGWWGMKQRDVFAMGREQTRYILDKLVPLVRPEHGAIWEKVVAGLGMEEQEATRETAHNIRQFLQSPRDLVGRPYPSLKADGSTTRNELTVGR